MINTRDIHVNNYRSRKHFRSVLEQHIDDQLELDWDEEELNRVVSIETRYSDSISDRDYIDIIYALLDEYRDNGWIINEGSGYSTQESLRLAFVFAR